MLFRTVWLYAWFALLVLCVVALFDVSEQTCQGHVPILLSRALTTDPWRGWILAFNLLAVGSSFYLNSIVMVTAFLGFLCAFLVSMFQTNAHNALILVSSACIMYETYPAKAHNWWRIHWWATLTDGQRGAASLAAFKRGSRAGFLAGYGSFVCGVADCRVCLSGG